jgi:hypothetical protein
MTPAAFVDRYLATAQQVVAGTGLDETTLLAQWALETAWGSVFAGTNNLGNIRCSPTTFCNYPTLAVFAQAAVQTFHNGLYAGVLATAGKSIETQIAALGNSPWDAGHYGNPPGSALIPFAQEIDMYSEIDRAFDRDIAARIAALLSNARSYTTHDGTVVSVPVTLADILAAAKTRVDLSPVLAAIADLKAHPAAIADPSVLAIVTRIENALKAA